MTGASVYVNDYFRSFLPARELPAIRRLEKISNPFAHPVDDSDSGWEWFRRASGLDRRVGLGLAFILVSFLSAKILQIPNKKSLFLFVSFLHSLGPIKVRGVHLRRDDSAGLPFGFHSSHVMSGAESIKN